MSEPDVEVLPAIDDPPKNDYWAPEVLEIEPTDEELLMGNYLGRVIDPDDDEDNGGVA